MTDEQTANSNTQVIADTESTQQAEDTSETQTKLESVESKTQKSPEPPNSQIKAQPKASPEQAAATTIPMKTSPEEPQFIIGAIFFLWIFCTLVFLSITAGYIATH